MNEKKNVWSKFSITYVLELAWNGIIFLYHFLWLGINDSTSAIIQISALLTEWLVTGIYEDRIFMSNTLINKKFQQNTLKKLLSKCWKFTVTFAIIFIPVYLFRLLIFYWLGWVTENQLESAILNTIPVTSILGPILGFIVIWRKKTKKKKLLQKQQQNRIRISSLIWEGLFLCILQDNQVRLFQKQ